jgi:hypothetical protein
MPTPTRPSVIPIWTQGNNGQRTQPTNGAQFAGFTSNQRPDPLVHNWLFGEFSDWIQWLDYITNSVSNLTVSNAGHHVATATTLQGQLDQLDAVLSSLGLYNEVPVGVVNGVNTTFILTQAPINAQSVIAFTDGIDAAPADFTVEQISGQWAIVFSAGSIPQTGQTPMAVYMTGSSGVGVGGGVGAIENVAHAGAVGPFYENDVNIALMKSFLSGTNMDIVDNGNGTMTFNASGGGGGGSFETHGSASSPTAITPSVGIVPTAAAEQVWWIAPVSGSGAVPITASPAIAAGSTIGQVLVLKSVANANYLTIANGSGTDMNGPINMGTFGQAIELQWDGTNWSENSRRV